LADPLEFANLFDNLSWAMKAEKLFVSSRSIPASEYINMKNNIDRNLIQEAQEAEARGDLTDETLPTHEIQSPPISSPIITPSSPLVNKSTLLSVHESQSLPSSPLVNKSALFSTQEPHSSLPTFPSGNKSTLLTTQETHSSSSTSSASTSPSIPTLFEKAVNIPIPPSPIAIPKTDPTTSNSNSSLQKESKDLDAIDDIDELLEGEVDDLLKTGDVDDMLNDVGDV